MTRSVGSKASIAAKNGGEEGPEHAVGGATAAEEGGAGGDGAEISLALNLVADKGRARIGLPLRESEG